MTWSGIITSIVLLAGLGGVAAASVTSGKTGFARRDDAAILVERLAVLDGAIARRDMSVAIAAWGEAYTAALATRRWDAMVDVGDAAARIDSLSGNVRGYLIGFRAEARLAYLRALSRARHARSEDGIARVARAFEALGDTDVAAQVHAIALSP